MSCRIQRLLMITHSSKGVIPVASAENTRSIVHISIWFHICLHCSPYFSLVWGFLKGIHAKTLSLKFVFVKQCCTCIFFNWRTHFDVEHFRSLEIHYSYEPTGLRALTYLCLAVECFVFNLRVVSSSLAVCTSEPN